MAQTAALRVVETEAPTGPIDLDPETVHEWMQKGEALVVDVRETAEFEAEHIPGTLLMPLSFLDPDAFPRVPGMKLVLLCAAGKRSAAFGKQLIGAGHPTPWHLKGGFSAWKDAGLVTED